MSDPVVLTDPVAYLTGKGVKVHRAKGTEITFQCPWCNEEHPKGKLYLNTETWLWDCKICGEVGNRYTLLDFYGDTDGLQRAGLDPSKRLRIMREVVELSHEMLIANEQIIDYLTGRGITPEIILREKLGYVPRNFGISDSLPGRLGDADNRDFSYADLIATGVITEGGLDTLNDSIVIPYWTHGQITQVRAKDMGGKYRTLANHPAALYNADVLQSAIEVIVVEGEFDRLVLQDALEKSGDRRLETIGVVALPGAGSWPDRFVDRLQEVDKRVFAGFDADETGDRFADKLVDELGTKARKIELPRHVTQPDWSDFLGKPVSPENPLGGKTWTFVRDLLTEAELVGKKLFSIEDASVKWERQRLETPGLKMGWPTIDEVMRPGLKPGQVMVPLATTGTGKTVLLSNMAHNLRDYGVLYISLEMTVAEVYEHFRRMHRFWHPKDTFEQMRQAYSKIRVTEENRIRPGDIQNYMEMYAEEKGEMPRVVIIDYLQYAARGFPGGSAYDRSTDAIMETKAIAKDSGSSLIVPSQVGRSGKAGQPLSSDSARDAGTIEETADFLLAVWRPELATPTDNTTPAPVYSGSLMAQLLKSRNGGQGRTFQLHWSAMSLAIVDPMDRAAVMRVESENNLARRGTHYDDYRAAQANVDAQIEMDVPLIESGA